MVAMGTSLADRAWGAESAVYRVAGVINVIGGWFGTAIGAFVASALVVYLTQFKPTPVMFPILYWYCCGWFIITETINHIRTVLTKKLKLKIV